jgi:hypothetical protein
MPKVKNATFIIASLGFSTAPLAPNAGRQARLKAGAERTL